MPLRKCEIMISNILEAMGSTPLIKLNRVVPEGSAQVLVKYEGLNVGGSIKTRTAFAMIEAAEREGKIGPNTIIAEPTSGNQGIGLALVGAVRGYKVVIVMPDSVSEERVKLMKQYGAEVKLVHDEGNIGECIDRCIETVRKMAEAAGFEKGEMFLKEKLAKSCGTLVAYSYMPEITLRVAGGRWADLLRTDCEAMLTANPQAYFLFEKTLPEGKKLVDLYGALL